MAKFYTDEMIEIIDKADKAARVDSQGDYIDCFNLGVTTMKNFLIANLLKHDGKESEKDG